MKKYLLPALSIFLLIASCKDEPKEQLCWDATNPDCENYDPCLSKNPVRAEFLMNERLGFVPPLRDSLVPDTLFSSKSAILFTALEKNAHYKWYLGLDTLSGSEYRIIERTVGNLPPGRYTAALVVQKEPDSLCFTKDDGRDSVLKTFTVVEFCDLMIHNRFKGVFEDSPNDSVEIEFAFADIGFSEKCAGEAQYGIGLFTEVMDPDNDLDTIRLSGLAGLSDSRVEWRRNGGFDGTANLNRAVGAIDLRFTYKEFERKFTGTVKN